VVVAAGGTAVGDKGVAVAGGAFVGDGWGVAVPGTAVASAAIGGEDAWRQA
jgi:hypothetical protein